MAVHPHSDGHAKGFIRKARFAKFCCGNVDHESCGREIAAGERYFHYRDAGVGTYNVCSDCAHIPATTN